MCWFHHFIGLFTKLYCSTAKRQSWGYHHWYQVTAEGYSYFVVEMYAQNSWVLIIWSNFASSFGLCTSRSLVESLLIVIIYLKIVLSLVDGRQWKAKWVGIHLNSPCSIHMWNCICHFSFPPGCNQVEDKKNEIGWLLFCVCRLIDWLTMCWKIRVGFNDVVHPLS